MSYLSDLPPADNDITQEVKEFCLGLGADLVGIAPPVRWENAPVERSPKGLMTSAEAVIVCGFHFLDACVELSENDDIRIPGAADANHIASGHGMWLAFKLAKFLEKKGWKAIPIPVTLWWNYRESDSAPRGFASDLTHYYAAVAAGLGEIGWSNICMTPKYGPRLRFISIVTDAPLTADPMYKGEPLCDHCMQCAKNCPIHAFDKEVDGTLTVDFGEKQFTFPNKNLWRCAAGENFNLDILADWPERIDESVILEFGRRAAMEDPSLRYGWKMGRCLKFCVPKERRYYDKGYSPSPRRRRDAVADVSTEALDAAAESLFDTAEQIGADCLLTAGIKAFEKTDIDLSGYLPGAAGIFIVGQSHPPGAAGDAMRASGRNALRLAKVLQEKYDFDCIVESGIDHAAAAEVLGFEKANREWNLYAVVTTMPVRNTQMRSFISNIDPGAKSAETDLTDILRDVAQGAGADLFGVTPVSRLDEIDAQLERIYADTEYFYSYEKGWGPKSSLPFEMKARPANPGIREKRLIPKRAEEYIAGAKSVIVIGLGLLNGSIDNAGKPPARKAGHYPVSTSQESILQNEEIALKLAKVLHREGYRVAITNDLEDLSSPLASTLQKDLKANRFPAVAAGLGELAENGLVLTQTFGSRVRYVAIVTDAELRYDEVYDGDRLCKACGACINACPVQALSGERSLKINVSGRTFRWAETDLLRCDWAARYGLTGAEGPCYTGSQNDFPVPEKITHENLTAAIRSEDRVQTTEYCAIVERCFTECPAGGQKLL